MKIKHHALLLVVLLLTVVGVVSAQTASSLEVTAPAFIRCSGTILEGSFGIDALDAGGGVINASTPISATIYATSSAGGSVVDSWSYLSGNSVTFAFTFPGAVSYVDIYVTAGGATSDLYRYGCDGTVTRFGGGGGADARINRLHGDLISALYAATDSSGKPTIRVYDIASDSTGILRGDYAYKLFEPYLNNPPSVNTVLGTLGRTKLIALTTGEFQINVGPDAEGKIHEITFTGLPPKNIKFASYLQ